MALPVEVSLRLLLVANNADKIDIIVLINDTIATSQWLIFNRVRDGYFV